MKELLIAIVGGFIGGLSGIIVYYYNLKKDRFFKLQEKSEELLKTLYEYQGILSKVDDLKDNFEIESIGVKDEKDLEKYNNIMNKYFLETDKKQKLREEIWVLINIYFPFLEKDFRKYTDIELEHNPELELNPLTLHSRENEILKISKKLILEINKERKVFFLFKI
ncbi:hypothetical protein H3C61_04055 [Candidatus Gracilibacteria bacterium]|nr:hypothetical protein [Candidatus Gracilibacteria bacterium]